MEEERLVKSTAGEEENEVEQIKAYLKILEQQLSGLKAILNKEKNSCQKPRQKSVRRHKANRPKRNGHGVK